MALGTFHSKVSFPVFIYQRQLRSTRHKRLVTKLLDKDFRDRILRFNRPMQTLEVALIADEFILFPVISKTQVVLDTQLVA